MRCIKCDGFMFYEKFIGQEIEDFSGWRCVICGEIVDEVILKNRTRQNVVAEDELAQMLILSLRTSHSSSSI